MSCLDVKATLLNLPVVVGFSLLSRMECSASILNPPLTVIANKATPFLDVQCSLVCSVNGNYFLYVEPDVVWITEDMLSGEFDIFSNVSWKIE